MTREEGRIGPAGWILAANIKRVREALRLSYAEMSRKLAETGRPIPELGLRRIEKGERRVDTDDLLALCIVLEISPVDLLVPITLVDHHTYLVAPDVAATAGNVREWVRGEDLLLVVTRSGDVYKPAAMINPIRWMPTDRANRVADRYFARREQKEDDR